MKKELTLLLFVMSIVIYAQETSKTIKSGVLHLVNDEQIEFIDLKYDGDKVYYINLQTQQREHLFLDSIASIDGENGQVDITTVTSTPKTSIQTTNIILKDGVYTNFEKLVQSIPQTGNYELKQRNGNHANYYYLINEDGKKEKTALAYVQDGELYLRAIATKEYFTKRKSQRFTGGNKTFVKMTRNENGQYIAEVPFANGTVSLLGAIVSGVVGGILAPGVGSAATIGAGGATIFSLASVSKQNLVVDLKNEQIFLE